MDPIETGMAWSVELLKLCLYLLAILGWPLYFHADRLKRDAYTDLCQLIHDYELTMDDIRRTRDHREIRNMVKRVNGDLTPEDLTGPVATRYKRLNSDERGPSVAYSDPADGTLPPLVPPQGEVEGLICSFCGRDGFDTEDELETHIEGHPNVVPREDDDGA